jgi:hypothetical protein
MKLSDLSITPQLVNVKIDDEEIVKQYGEPIEFWIYDRQPMQTFMKMATVEEKGVGELAEVVLELILDEDGKPMLEPNQIPPATVMMRVITKVVDHLGNLERLTTA